MALRQRRGAEKLGRLVVDDVGFRHGEVFFDLVLWLMRTGMLLCWHAAAGRGRKEGSEGMVRVWKATLKLGGWQLHAV